MRNRTVLDDPADVAVYTSDEFALPQQISGRMAADLHTACDMPSHDAQRTLPTPPPGDSRAPTSGPLRVTMLRIAHDPMRPSRLFLPVHA